MSNRWLNVGVCVFWLVAMSWLLTQKVLPPMLSGNPPDYDAALPIGTKAVAPPAACWRLQWDGRIIGTAVSQPIMTPAGAEMRSVIRFSRLPVRNLLTQLLGSMAPLVTGSFGDENFAYNMHVATRLRFNEERRLQNFQTVLDLPDQPQFIDLDGKVDETGRLMLIATARFGTPVPGEPPPFVRHRHALDLPPDALVGDSLSPRSELRNLHVGQQWTIPVYRPFPPNSPVQILLAKVEKSEFIEWNGDLVETYLVVYQDEAGSGLGAARQPIGRTWVQPDGNVLRQEMMLSSLKFTFERIPPEQALEAIGWLQDAAFNQHFEGLEANK
jgi:hypothetical protein